MYRTALALSGLEVHEAGDGLEALRHMEQSTPDIIVLDLVLPNIGDMAFRQEVAAHAHTRDIPVIIVTDSPGARDLDEPCILHKPVSSDQLVSTVLRCLKSGSPGMSS